MKTLYFVLFAFIISACGSKSAEPAEQTRDSVETADTTAAQPEAALTDKSIRVAWRGNVYYSQINDSVNMIMVDTVFCKSISAPERAALGFVVTFIGNECVWDGDAKEDMSNLKCKLTDALKLGYQCSEQHMQYLRQWFKNDASSLLKLKDCPLMPYTATSQTTFDEIRLTVKDSTIKVWYKANGMDMRTNDAWYWTEEDVFELQNNSLKLVKQKKLNERKEKFAA